MSSTTVTRKKNTSIASYSVLRSRVRGVLHQAKRLVEMTKVRAYWAVGKNIDDHVRAHGGDRGYPRLVAKRLARDEGIGETVVYRLQQFAQMFPEPPNFTHLTWSHYRILCAVRDPTKRLELARRADVRGWSNSQLALEVKRKIWRDEGVDWLRRFHKLKGKEKPLRPLRGKLYTYQLFRPKGIPALKNSLWIDLGFNRSKLIPSEMSKRLRAEHIIESVGDGFGSYRFMKSKRTKRDLFTYKAYVPRVVDADTLYIHALQGFGDAYRDYFRLRDIDAPELSTPEGKKARAFVVKELKGVPYVTIRSGKSGKYRYVGDVFYTKRGIEKYLNQELLNHGHAIRYRDS
jgi:endonuclease YncB( thermonuclease family)